MDHYKAAVAADSSLENYFLDQVPQYYSAQISAGEARSLLDRSLIVKPDDPLAYFYYAQIEANEGNPIEAIKHYEKTVSLDPSYADVYLWAISIMTKEIGKMLPGYIKRESSWIQI